MGDRIEPGLAVGQPALDQPDGRRARRPARPIEGGAVVFAGVDIAQEVGGGDGRPGGFQRQEDQALIGLDGDPWLGERRLGEGRRRGQEARGDEQAATGDGFIGQGDVLFCRRC
jgi:hypothetical protein